MIGYLSGKIVVILKDRIILETNGIGYELLCSPSLLASLDKIQTSKINLFVYSAAKENSITLIGFEKLEQKLMFERLLKVPAVGPKTALLVLSTYSPDEITQAVEEQNIDVFLKIKGLAKKTSQKIIIELRSQFKALKKETDKELGDRLSELHLALTAMGFASTEIKNVLHKINHDDPIPVQVKKALKFLTK